jgi:hypothetical protein
MWRSWSSALHLARLHPNRGYRVTGDTTDALVTGAEG